MDVSVIIVNYNTRQMTLNCIDSIFEKTEGVRFEVILVDNASNDGSVDFFRRDKRIVFVASPDNIGFGRANNLGYKYASGRYIFLLNSDTLLLNNALFLFVQAMDALPKKVACTGCRLRDDKGNIARSYLLQPTLWKSLQCFIYQRFLPESGKDMLDSNEPFEVEGVSGADMFIRREVIEECGLFDPDFFMYYEETEMQKRFLEAGYKLYILPEPSIVHLEGGSQVSIPNMNKRLLSLRSVLLYHKKTRTSFQLFRLLLFIGSLPILLKTKYTLVERLKYLRTIWEV